MKKYKIFAGLGGGFGGAQELFIEEYESMEDAEEAAYIQACEVYESYEGLHGLRTIYDIMEEDEVDEDCAEEIYWEERDGWLEYYVEEVTEEEKQ